MVGVLCTRRLAQYAAKRNDPCAKVRRVCCAVGLTSARLEGQLADGAACSCASTGPVQPQPLPPLRPAVCSEGSAAGGQAPVKVRCPRAQCLPAFPAA